MHRLVFFFLALMMPIPAANAQDAERSVLEALFGAEPVRAEMFADTFLKAVPLAQVQPILDQTKAEIGPVTAIEHRGGTNFALVTDTYEQPVVIELDPAGRIINLLLRPGVPRSQTVADVLAGFSTLAPEVAYLVTKDGAVLHAARADEALAVGSGFKLGIVGVLKDRVEAGSLKWSDVVTLKQADISLPTGVLQGFPVGAPVTVHTLAALMVSLSDNTATDALLDLVGREAVEARLGMSGPVLSTRELFVLKADAALRERFLAGDDAEKRAALAEAASRPLPSVGAITAPHQEGIEYYLPLSGLCALMEEVADLDVMRINPGVANPADWAEVGFKGGSDVGVMHFTTRLKGKDGSRYCVAATFNAPDALDEQKAVVAYGALLSQLARG